MNEGKINLKQLTLKMSERPYEIAEELKSLRTNIQFCGEDKQVIMLTSSIGGEGKSTITLDLAKTFAEQEKRVLIIDADLRKSVVGEKVISGTIESGLTQYLSGQCLFEDALYLTEIENVSIIPAGAVAPNPSELLSNKRFKNLIEKVRQEYDYVLIDCAPLGMVVDAATVAPNCDGAVLVIQSRAIKYRLAQEVLQKLNNTKCPILGVVLNKVDHRKGKYGYYYKYDKKYETYYK